MDTSPAILIVDDEVHYLNLLVGILKDDYRLIAAKSGLQAIELLQVENPPQLIVLDVVMPGIDGYETCRRLKQHPVGQNIPIIFLTARDDVEAETQGFKLGAVDYITKPISAATVKARIRTHLELRAARRELERQNRVLEERVLERTKRLRTVSAELMLAEERERRRIAKELHDGPAQRLALSCMNLGEMRDYVDPRKVERLDEVIQDNTVTLKELRTLMVQLSPPALHELGLASAIEWLAEAILQKQRINCGVEAIDTYSDLEEETRVFLFQSVRELFINIVKHAKASCVSVSLNTVGERIEIEISDDGVGFESFDLNEEPSADGGFGLFTLRDRIDMLGGSFTIYSSNGTHVTLQVPYRRIENAP